jgi:hypothetical protein
MARYTEQDGGDARRGIRIIPREGLPMDAGHPGLNRAFPAAKHGLLVNMLCWGILDKGLPHIQRHPGTVIRDRPSSACSNRPGHRSARRLG